MRGTVKYVTVALDALGWHIAFACEGLPARKANLDQHGIQSDERVLPRLNMTQLFYYDPDGIAVECNFPPGETVAR